MSAGFVMGLFTLSVGAIGTFFGLPLFLAYLICGSSILFFLSGFAFDLPYVMATSS